MNNIDIIKHHDDHTAEQNSKRFVCNLTFYVFKRKYKMNENQRACVITGFLTGLRLFR